MFENLESMFESLQFAENRLRDAAGNAVTAGAPGIPERGTSDHLYSTPEAQADREALVALFRATNGANWKHNDNWDTDANLSKWHGVKVGFNGRVVELALISNNLQGPIPDDLEALSELETIVLSGNHLSGEIPASLGQLGKLRELYLYTNKLIGRIPPELGDLGLERLDLSWNKLDGLIPPELGKLESLEHLDLVGNYLSGAIPRELGNLKGMGLLQLEGNSLEGPFPPRSYGMEMREWAGCPTEAERLKVRGAGVELSDAKQPRIVTWLGFITDAWHIVVPVVDDFTDVLLLTSTADIASPFWWICLIALVVADVERLWLLSTMILTIVLLPYVWWHDPPRRHDVESSSGRRNVARFFARLNCRGDAPLNTFGGRLLDSVLWVVVGARSRCSPLWRLVGMSLDAEVEEADHAGLGFGAIDKWVAGHPFSFLGNALFGNGFKVKGGTGGVSRGARVMIRAVGETVVVDSLFLVLSVVSGGWDGNLTGVAGVSALFSVLELLTELQYYVAKAGAVMEPVSSSTGSTTISPNRSRV